MDIVNKAASDHYKESINSDSQNVAEPPRHRHFWQRRVVSMTCEGIKVPKAGLVSINNLTLWSFSHLTPLHGLWFRLTDSACT